MGRAEEEVGHQQLAVTGDPLQVQYRTTLAGALMLAGREVEAEALLEKAAELAPNVVLPFMMLTWIRVKQERWPEALVCAEKAHALAPWQSAITGLLAGILLRTGAAARGQELLKTVGDGSAYGDALAWAMVSLLAGDIERAWEWMEKSVEQRHPATLLVLFGPHLSGLRDTPGWRRLAKKIRLPGY